MMRKKAAFLLVAVIASLLGASIIANGAISNAGANTGLIEGQPPVPREIPREVADRIGPIDTTPPPISDNSSSTKGIAPLTTQEPVEFLAQGGRAVIIIKTDTLNADDLRPAVTTIEVKRGSIVEVPLAITHLSGTNAVESLTIVGKGVSNGYVPAAVVHEKTPEQRTQELLETGKITGELDLNSTLQFLPERITLKPNETENISLMLSIPKDWPNYVVDEMIWYSVQFSLEESEQYGSSEIRMNQVPLQVHIME